MDEQSDELPPVDKDDDEDIVLPPWRRAGEALKSRSGASRVRVSLPLKRLKNDKNDWTGSNGKRKRDPQGKEEDEQEGREQKKSPPSPPDNA